MVLADYHLGGNLVLLRPGLTVLPPLPQAASFPEGRVLLLFRGTTARDVAATFKARGFVPPDAAGRGAAGQGIERLALPYLRPTDARFEITAILLPKARLTPAP